MSCITLYDCLFHTVHDTSTNTGYTKARSMFLTAPSGFMQFYFLIRNMCPLLMYVLLKTCYIKLLAHIYMYVYLTAQYHISEECSLDVFGF
jgi:hypothetical protein